MLISDKMTAALTEQIGNEFAASLQYSAIAAYFAAESLPELSGKFMAQATEERDHALKLVDYVVDSGGHVEFPSVPGPRSTFGSAEEAVQLALDSELDVTKQINRLMDLAASESDHAAQTFLQWFVNEQREEVASMDTLLKIVQRAGETGLLFVEEYLARNGLAPAPSTQPAGE